MRHMLQNELMLNSQVHERNAFAEKTIWVRILDEKISKLN